MMLRTLLFLSLFACSSAHALITMNLRDESYNGMDGMMLAFSGSADTTDLFFIHDTTASAFINLSLAHFSSSKDDTMIALYAGTIAGPLDLGIATYIGGYVSGDSMVISPNFSQIYLPTDYVSGSFISGQSFFAGTSIAAMGLTSGDIFEWSWGAGAYADKVVLVIGTIPEPATVTLLSAGTLALLAVVGRRRRK